MKIKTFLLLFLITFASSQLFAYDFICIGEVAGKFYQFELSLSDKLHIMLKEEDELIINITGEQYVNVIDGNLFFLRQRQDGLIILYQIKINRDPMTISIIIVKSADSIIAFDLANLRYREINMLEGIPVATDVKLECDASD